MMTHMLGKYYAHERTVSQQGKDCRNVTNKYSQKFSADRLAVPRPFMARKTLSEKVDNPPGRASIHVKTAGVPRARRGNRSPVCLPSPECVLSCAKRVLNRCLKRCKAVQNCDTFGVPGMMPKWPFSRGIRERAWGESNTRPAA